MFTFAGVELCGPVLAKYQELGGPEGSLGDPIAPPEAPNTRAASGSTRVKFTGGGGIYSSAVGGARYLGEAMFAKYAELDYEASNLGVPVSDEIDNDGESAATYGSRRGRLLQRRSLSQGWPGRARCLVDLRLCHNARSPTGHTAAARLST